MPKSKSQKQTVIKELTKNLKKSKMVVLADFKGLKVKEITELRRELRKNNSACEVVKKTMMSLAFKEAGINYDAAQIPGNIISLSFDLGHSLTPVKMVTKFGKTHENVEVIGGLLDGAFIGAAQVKILANLPSREELLAKLVGSIQSPLSGFVNVLAGNLRGFVQVLNARREALEKASI